MTFIIVLLALVVERFLHWHHFRHWRWFSLYERWVGQRVGQYVLSPSLTLAATVLPPLLLIMLVRFAGAHQWSVLFLLVFNTILVLYCLGPDNLWTQVKEGVHPLNPGRSETLVRAIFIAANQRLFAVLFWFVVIGPLGAVLYRLVESTAKQDINAAPLADQIKQLLDWLPIRMLTILFALAGHFMMVFNYWREYALDRPERNEAFLSDCGLAALPASINEGAVPEQIALALIDRALIIGLVILAMLFY